MGALNTIKKRKKVYYICLPRIYIFLPYLEAITAQKPEGTHVALRNSRSYTPGAQQGIKSLLFHKSILLYCFSF